MIPVWAKYPSKRDATHGRMYWYPATNSDGSIRATDNSA